ncbi:MAG: hypothetical protein ACSLFF_05150 [Solirubrobacterales bacterium]
MTAETIAEIAGLANSTVSGILQRMAYVEVLTDEKATTAIGFLRRAVACFALDIKHIRTRP